MRKNTKVVCVICKKPISMCCLRKHLKNNAKSHHNISYDQYKYEFLLKEKFCPICNKKFKHASNKTCSKECAKILRLTNFKKNDFCTNKERHKLAAIKGQKTKRKNGFYESDRPRQIAKKAAETNKKNGWPGAKKAAATMRAKGLYDDKDFINRRIAKANKTKKKTGSDILGGRRAAKTRKERGTDKVGADKRRVTFSKKGRKNKNYKSGWYISIKSNEKYFFDSSWEYIRMRQLDEDEAVLWWAKNFFKITIYKYQKKEHEYEPDFLIIENINNVITPVIEEVKGYSEDIKVERSKTRAIKKHCKKNNFVFRMMRFKNIFRDDKQKALHKKFMKEYDGLKIYS